MPLDRVRSSFAAWRYGLRRRLIVPMVRGRHEPEHTARGVLFGLLVAFTPTVGMQMPMVFLLWLAVRRLRREWDFHLVLALAWTWITNVITVPPLYYLYIVTGRVMLGRWEDLRGYDAFQDRLAQTLSPDFSWYESIWVYVINLFKAFGVPLFVGCVPWAVLCSWLGYRWSLGLVKRVRMARARRRRRTH